MKLRKLPRVALLIESSRAYGRDLLHGIASYVREHGPWSVYFQECKLGELPSWLDDWQGDGLIVRIESREMADFVRNKRLPAVDVRGLMSVPGVPMVVSDNTAIMRLALEHLIECGFRHVAYCGFAGVDYSEIRLRSVEAAVERSGVLCHCYEPGGPRFRSTYARSSGTLRFEEHGLVYEQELEEWLRRLPMPVGVMACNDVRGQQIINACRNASLVVPDEVAVVGVDNDTLLCDLSDPPLSSVEPDTRRVGYEAAALLTRLMDGRKPPRDMVVIPPVGVVRRRSTDVLAMDDRAVAAGLRFIREHAFERLKVDFAARAAGLSRRIFERRFLQRVGRTPKAELLRIRVERAKHLLVSTELSLLDIAERCGFSHGEYLHSLFKQKTGQTPGEFRRRARLPGRR